MLCNCLPDMKRAICETLHLQEPSNNDAVVSAIAASVSAIGASAYERVWQERMQHHSPEGTYSERLRNIDHERAVFAAMHVSTQ